MKTWLIGDLHGKINVFNKVMDSTEPDKLVFVGDILDSFDLNVQDQINIMDRMLHEVKNDPTISCIIGNHELSYINNKKYACSGHMAKTQYFMNTRNKDVLKYFKRCLIVDDFLITHAGVSDNWLPKEIDKTCIEDIETYICDAELDDLMQVGCSRGGYFPVGGPFWCDFWGEFKPITGLKQIFGHTAKRFAPEFSVIEMVEGNYNIDCLDHTQEILEINDGEVRFIRL